jgi:hypothetical protein
LNLIVPPSLVLEADSNVQSLPGLLQPGHLGRLLSRERLLDEPDGILLDPVAQAVGILDELVVVGGLLLRGIEVVQPADRIA